MSAMRMRLAATCVATAGCAVLAVEGSAHDGASGGPAVARHAMPPAAAPAAGDQVVIDFQSLEIVDDALHDWGHEYEEDGYRISNPVQETTLKTYGVLAARYPGSTALFNSQTDGVVTLERADGAAFDAFSIKLSNLIMSGRATVDFVGNLSGGGTVEASFQISEENEGQNVLEEFVFEGFTSLESLEWTQVSPFHQFDDITLSEGIDLCGNCPCAADTDRNGAVDFNDILLWLENWGSCPPAPRGGASTLWGLSCTTPARIYTLDPETGEATELVQTNGNASFCGLSLLDGDLYGSDLFGYEGESFTFDTGRIDPDTGVITFVSDQDGSLDWHGLAADETAGLLYAIDFGATDFPLKSLAPDGTVQTIGNGTTVDGRGLAYDDASGTLYATHSPKSTLHRIDTTTGTADEGLPLGVAIGTEVGLAFDEGTSTLFMNVAATGKLYTVDVATGQATEIGENLAANIGGLAWSGSADRCGSCPCPADINRDDEVDFDDLLPILSNWGPCP